MNQRVGRMISLEIGVEDEGIGKEIAALMMGEPSPAPGSEHAITDGSVLRYLRAFKVLEPSGPTAPGVWVDFGITYDENAAADAIVEWLLDTLGKHVGRLTLKVDTSEVALELEAMTTLIRRKVEQSL